MALCSFHIPYIKIALPLQACFFSIFFHYSNGLLQLYVLCYCIRMLISIDLSLISPGTWTFDFFKVISYLLFYFQQFHFSGL